MTQIALHLRDVPLIEIIQRGRNVLTALTGNPDVPAPMPTLPELQAVLAAAEAADLDYEVAKAALRMLKTVRDNAVKALGAALRTEASTVQVATGGDPVKILSAGFAPKSNGAPVGLLEQPQRFMLKPGIYDGSLKGRWKPVRGARSYEIEISADGPTSASWVNRGAVTKAKALLTGLPSGTKIWVRVRGVGAAGGGQWSEPMGRIVP